MKDGKQKLKHIEVDVETHTMAKAQAYAAGIPMKEYVKLCIIACKSDKVKSN